MSQTLALRLLVSTACLASTVAVLVDLGNEPFVGFIVSAAALGLCAFALWVRVSQATLLATAAVCGLHAAPLAVMSPFLLVFSPMMPGGAILAVFLASLHVTAVVVAMRLWGDLRSEARS